MTITLREFFYISNILSFSRVVLLFPIYHFLSWHTTRGNYLAVVFMLLAAATDNFDGRLARRLKQTSDLGRIIDPLADKICVAVVGVILVSTRDLPLWFFLAVIARDLMIVILGMFLVLRTRQVMESDMLGKVTVTALATVIITFTIDISPLKWYFLWCSVILLLASAVNYFVKMVHLLRKGTEYSKA